MISNDMDFTHNQSQGGIDGWPHGGSPVTPRTLAEFTNNLPLWQSQRDKEYVWDHITAGSIVFCILNPESPCLHPEFIPELNIEGKVLAVSPKNELVVQCKVDDRYDLEVRRLKIDDILLISSSPPEKEIET